MNSEWHQLMLRGTQESKMQLAHENDILDWAEICKLRRIKRTGKRGGCQTLQHKHTQESYNADRLFFS